jgi:hypothetical protein
MLAPEFAMVPAVYAEGQAPAAANAGSQQAATAYDKCFMTDLDNAGAFVISKDFRDKVEVSHTEYGNSVLLKGKVEDLNTMRITLNKEFNFNSGSVGRLSFDGLKDKDSGMSVSVLVYLDDADSPVAEISLRKQMGKREWSNAGEKSVSMGSANIKGKHKVSLGFSVTGKDASKKTSISLRSIKFYRTVVPVLYFDIDESEGTIGDMNSSEDHSAECYGSVDLIVPDEFNADKTFRDEYGEQESLEDLQLEYIRGRGNSTWTENKKPYKVKFDKGQDLFGFGKNKHWTLLADRFDNSLVRNRMTYWLGRKLGMEYTPECVPVEVVMNGEYYGSYLLCEQVRVGTGRVTIDDLDDIKDVPAVTDPLIETGGYLLSKDLEEDEKRSFTTKSGMHFFIESPDDNVAYYNEYIKAYTQKVEDAVMGENFKDSSGKPYTDYLDMDSAVDYWWVQEFSCNGDAYCSGSTYLYKKRDTKTEKGKLYWGPLWDFDYVAWGDLEYGSEAHEDLNYTSNDWFDCMKYDPEFVTKVKRRWSEKGGLKDLLNEITRKGGKLDQYKAQMETVYNYDHEKWGAYESTIKEYSGEIEQLRSWINDRSKKVDKAVARMNAEEHTVRFVINGKTVKKVKLRGILRGFPKAPRKKGYEFSGWEAEDGVYYYEGEPLTSDLVLTAVYTPESEIIRARHIYFKNYDVYYVRDTFDEEGASFYYPQDYTIMPEGAVESDVTWSVSDKSLIEPTDDGYFEIKGNGDFTVKITARLSNGVKRSYRLHVLDNEDLLEFERIKLSKTKVTLREGQYTQVEAIPYPQPCWDAEVVFLSTDEDVVKVNEIGVITAQKPGKAEILVVNLMNREVSKCKVTVKRASNKGVTVKRNGSKYKIIQDVKGKRRAKLVKAKNAASVTIPVSIKYDGRIYYINKISPKAFSKSKASKVTIRTKKLTKKTVKGALKGSRVNKIVVRVGKKKSTNNKYMRKYKKIFTRRNAGKKVRLEVYRKKK